MFGLGTKELVIIVLVLFLLFGAGFLPKLAKGWADSIRQVKSTFKK